MSFRLYSRISFLNALTHLFKKGFYLQNNFAFGQVCVIFLCNCFLFGNRYKETALLLWKTSIIYFSRAFLAKSVKFISFALNSYSSPKLYRQFFRLLD